MLLGSKRRIFNHILQSSAKNEPVIQGRSRARVCYSHQSILLHINLMFLSRSKREEFWSQLAQLDSLVMGTRSDRSRSGRVERRRVA